MQNNTKVLIIGAGPTGLMMAAQLAIRNIPFRIIDKNEDHTTQSRALVVHARSLEIFEQMGIATDAIHTGKRAKALDILVNGKKAMHLNVENIGCNLTEFPFLLMLEQSETELLLNNFIESKGFKVERNSELIDFSQDPTGVKANIRTFNGNEEIIHADWLVGADGAHSKVRNILHIPFEGKTYQQSLFVLDCETDVPFPSDELSAIVTGNHFTGFFPLTNGRYRVIGTIPQNLRGKEKINFEDIEDGFSKRINMNVSLSNPYWISKYYSHHRVVSTFRKGRCFLAGDAAHIHSPIGAQGMNTGLQDIYNLAWKLAFVIEGKANGELLDTYHEERITIAKNLVTTTDMAFNLVSSKEFFTKLFRKYLFPSLLKLTTLFIERSNSIRKFVFRTVSQIRINYKESSLSKEEPNSVFPKHAPRAGDRIPYLKSTELVKGTEEFTRGIKFHLLLFTGMNHKEKFQLHIDNCELIELHEIPANLKTNHLYKLFGIEKEGFFFIRPDAYIGYRSTTLDFRNLQEYLSSVLIT